MMDPTSASEHFRKNAVAEAEARVRNTSMAKAGMLGMRNTTARSQRYERPASRSAIQNGRFYAPGYEYTADAGEKRGGTGLITKDGRAWVHKALQERVKQLEAISTGAFLAKPGPISVNPSTDGVDAALQPLVDSLQMNYISSFLPSMAQQVQTAILRAGASMSETDLVRVYQVVLNAQQSIRSLKSSRREGPVPVEQSKILNLVDAILNRTEDILKELSKTVSQPPAARQFAVNAISRRLGIALVATPEAAAAEPEVPIADARRAARERAFEGYLLSATDRATRANIRELVGNEFTKAAKNRVIKRFAEDLGISQTQIQYIVAHPEMEESEQAPGVGADPVGARASPASAQASPGFNLSAMFQSSQFPRAASSGALAMAAEEEDE
jgi:hypothetical protein